MRVDLIHAKSDLINTGVEMSPTRADRFQIITDLTHMRVNKATMMVVRIQMMVNQINEMVGLNRISGLTRMKVDLGCMRVDLPHMMALQTLTRVIPFRKRIDLAQGRVNLYLARVVLYLARVVLTRTKDDLTRAKEKRPMQTSNVITLTTALKFPANVECKVIFPKDTTILPSGLIRRGITLTGNNRNSRNRNNISRNSITSKIIHNCVTQTTDDIPPFAQILS